MKYRRLGNAGLKVSEISIGGWLTFGGTVDEAATDRILQAAIENGVNFIDLADIYSRGKAEATCGKLIKKYNRTDLVISSKVFWPMSDDINDRGLSRKHIFESIDKTLKRLDTDYLDLYFCHRFDPDTEIEETVRAMDDLIRQGKILGSHLVESGHVNFGEFLLCELAGWFATFFTGSFFKEKPTLGFNTAHERIQDENGTAKIDFVLMTGTAVAEVKNNRWFVLTDFSG